MKEEPKFKVGDWVVCIPDGLVFPGDTFEGTKQVISIREKGSGGFAYDLGNPRLQYMFDEELRTASPALIALYEIT